MQHTPSILDALTQFADAKVGIFFESTKNIQSFFDISRKKVTFVGNF